MRVGTARVRGWAGRPEYGNSLLVQEPLVATDVERVDLGHNRAAHRALVGAARRVVRPDGRHPPPPPDPGRGDPRRAEPRPSSPGCAMPRRRRRDVLVGDFNADPAEPTPSAAPRGRLPVRLRGGERRGAAGHLAVRADGAGDGHRRRPGLPRLHLGPRRGPGHIRAARASTDPIPRTRRSTRATISGSRPGSRSGRGVAGPSTAPAGAPRRLPARPGELAGGVRGGAREPAPATASSSMSALGRRRPGHQPRRHARARPRPPERVDEMTAARARGRSASRPSPTCSRLAGREPFLDVELKGDPGPAAVEVACRRARAGARPGGRVVVRARPRSSGSPCWRRPGRAGSTARPRRGDGRRGARARLSRGGRRLACARPPFGRARHGGRSRGRRLDRPSPGDVRPPGASRRGGGLRRGGRARRLSGPRPGRRPRADERGYRGER